VVPSDVKAPGFVRRPHRSRGRSKTGLGAHGSQCLSGQSAAASFDKGARLRFRAGLSASCRCLVESGRPVKRELDSQPGNRCFAARGLRWPAPALNTLVRGITGRQWVCSTFTLVAEADGWPPVRRKPLGGRRRSGSWNAGTVHAVRREATRSGASEESRFARWVGTTPLLTAQTLVIRSE
jgi:hypothetical protein